MRAIERKVYILLTKEQFNNENFKIAEFNLQMQQNSD